jgi:hypothetical protein
MKKIILVSHMVSRTLTDLKFYELKFTCIISPKNFVHEAASFICEAAFLCSSLSVAGEIYEINHAGISIVSRI